MTMDVAIPNGGHKSNLVTANSNHTATTFGAPEMGTYSAVNTQYKQGGSYTTSTLGTGVRTSTTYQNSNPMTMDVVVPGQIRESRVSTIRGAAHDTGVRIRGEERLISVVEGQTRVVGERKVTERKVNEYLNYLEEKVIQPDFIPQARRIRKSQRELVEEEIVYVEKFVDKPVEVIKERKVEVERIVEVPYDVIVEKPIEKIIEMEIEVEKIVERPVVRTVEVPIEKIVEIPVEKVIEQPREVKVFVNKPFETIREKMIEQVYENPIYHDTVQEVDVNDLHRYNNYEMMPREVRVNERRVEVDIPVYHDNIIEKVVDRPYETIIEVPKERIIEKQVENIIEKAVYYDNIIEQVVNVPVEHVIHKEVEHLVEVPVYIDNIIRKPVPMEVEREVVQEVQVDQFVEEPYYTDNIIERIVEVPVHKEVFVEREKIVEVPNFVDRRVQLNSVEAGRTVFTRERPNVVEKVEEVPIEMEIWKNKPVLQEHVVSVQVPKFNVNKGEQIIQMQIDCEVIVEQPVPVTQNKEVIVENIIEKPVYVEDVIEKRVSYDQVIEQEYEVLVPNYITREVVKEIQVPRRTKTQQPHEVQRVQEREIHVNSTVVVPVEGREILEGDAEVQDAELDQRIRSNRESAQRLNGESQRLQQQIAQMRSNQGQQVVGKLNNAVRQNAHLEADMSELQSRIEVIRQHNEQLGKMAQVNNQTHQVQMRVPAPEVTQYRRQLESLLEENRRLVNQVRSYQ